MMITAWRITKKKYRAQAFTGQGAKEFGGRWNPPGIAAIYTADSLALAILEMLVHLDDYNGIREYVAVPIRFDDAKVISWNIDMLPKHWNSHPIGAATQRMGQQWFNANSHAVLKVPSAVVPQQYNYVLNPLHADFTTFSIGPALDDPIDMRLIKVQNR
jgi:RES domain-containing protein